MKAQVPLVEMVTVLIAIFITFGILFPGFVYKDKWKEAKVMLLTRDLILTMDRTGFLYQFSFNKSTLRNFLERTVPEKNLIPWCEVEGTFPNQIMVACNCTEEEINKMNFWFNPLFLNKRRIYIIFFRSTLEEIPQETDVILIKNYKNLANYNSILQKYISRGIGIVEMMNFNSQSEIDIAQKQIFGINCTGSVGITNFMNFTKPENSSVMVYTPYKNFYHVPIPLNSSLSLTYPDCKNEGNFVLNKTIYKFWICNDTYVWFDVDGNSTRDVIVRVGESFRIGKYNFTLNYIHNSSIIAISFKNKPEYYFGNYLPTGKCNVLPNDGRMDRILVKGFGQIFYPAVILNSSRIAWMYDFGDQPSDDEKTLLLSLILWASKKKFLVLSAPLQKGISSSYINIKNDDIFEVYKFTLGLSYPY